MNILITGASGFVGINVTKLLSKSDNVKVFVRNGQKANNVFQNNVEICLGDILDIESLKRSMHNIDYVVHIAGLIKAYDVSKLYKVNRTGCKNVALAAKNSKVKNVIYLSSLAARGPDGSTGPVSHYGLSKLQGEYELMKHACDFTLTILRPPIIYGEYEKEFFKLFKMAKIGFMPVLKNRLLSLLYVQDLANAIKMIIYSNRDTSKIYYISDGYKYSWEKIADIMFDVVGRKKIRTQLTLSPVFANIVAYSTYFMKDKAPFTLDKINEIKAQGWTCSYEMLKKDLNFEPKYAIRDGLEETFGWYEENGWI